MSELGNFLKTARERKGLRQIDLAEKVKVSATYIANIERGQQRGGYNTLLKIAKALDLPGESVLRKGGFEVLGVSETEYHPLELEDYQFQKLQPRIKKVLLEIAPILWRHLEKA